MALATIRCLLICICLIYIIYPISISTFFLSILINVLELLVIDGIYFHQSFLRDLGFNLFVLLISVKVVHNLYEARKFLKHLQCTRMCTQFPKFKGG